jgi:hypothetical protein
MIQYNSKIEYFWMEVDPSIIPTSVTATLFYPATNSVNVDDELV